MTDICWDRLIDEAQKARERAYAPYSHFKVGAALLCGDGSIVAGCNIENVSFGLTNCAERTAIFSAVAQGKKDFKALAVWADTKKPIAPCGACRQVLAELAPKMPVLLLGQGEAKILTDVDKLLPQAFDESFLGKESGEDEE